jgi:hypothetical protein
LISDLSTGVCSFSYGLKRSSTYFTVGGAYFTVGGAYFTVGGAYFTVGGAYFVSDHVKT